MSKKKQEQQNNREINPQNLLDIYKSVSKSVSYKSIAYLYQSLKTLIIYIPYSSFSLTLFSQLISPPCFLSNPAMLIEKSGSAAPEIQLEFQNYILMFTTSH